MKRLLVLVSLVAITACDVVINSEGGGGGNGSGSGSSGVFPTPTGPTPTPTPSPGTPTPTTPGRTPDPIGGFLPLPTYGPSLLPTIPVDPGTHCIDYGFLDAMVDALRQKDTRWGYVCKDASCTIVSQDKIAYHATAGAEVTGALGNWVVDVINAACEAPTRQWLVDGYNANIAWSSRGRF